MEKMSEEEAFQILDLALDQQISYLDTAKQYGDSEQVIGRYLQKRGSGDAFKIITKIKVDEGEKSTKKVYFERD
jgi:aryl-alcohol dehydrogenase-like predicted oxidoreductase